MSAFPKMKLLLIARGVPVTQIIPTALFAALWNYETPRRMSAADNVDPAIGHANPSALAPFYGTIGRR